MAHLTAHQNRLAKLDFIEQYDLILNPYRSWADTHRARPDKVNYVTEYKPGYYDFAILHVDQQCIYNPAKGDRISKGRLYSEVNEVIQDIPKIVINHMTPFHDKYESDYVVDEIRRMVGGNHMLLNSHEAAKQWGWGTTITHGMNPDDWKPKPKEPRVVVALSPAGMEKAYRRTFLHAVRRLLKDKGVPFVWIGPDKKFGSQEAYSDYLGRSLVYFNPTYQSPRPGARTEAMLAGCCIVTTPYQDADTFIEDGVNGFLTSKARIKDPRIMDSPEYTANLLEKLVMKEPELAIRIGKEGRRTAMELFSHDKFAEQWKNYLKGIGIWK